MNCRHVPPYQVFCGAEDQVQVLLSTKQTELQPQVPLPPSLSGYSVICTAGFLPYLSPVPLSGPRACSLPASFSMMECRHNGWLSGSPSKP